MPSFDRRDFLKMSGIGVTAAMSGITLGQANAADHKAPMVGLARKMPLPKAKGQRVVIIGGGVSGLTIARYLKNQDVDFDVVLLERNALYQFCPISNLYLVGGMDLGFFTRSYLDAARNGGYTYVQATAYDADLESQVVYTDQGHVAYDYLVVAPGIDYNYGSIGVEDPVDEGKLRQRYPAGFVPGSEHLTLRHKLHNFKGGVFVNTTPPGNYRCLPAPYERTCLIADYMKKNKLKGKVIHLDANPDITIKKKGFHAAFEELYGDYVEYVPSFEFNGVDVENKVIHSTFDKIEFDDASIYPRVRASKLLEVLNIARMDSPQKEADIDPFSYAVKGYPNVFATGDSRWMPYSKSANTANSEGHFVARVIANASKGKETEWLSPHTVCFSMVEYDPLESIMVDAHYGYDKKTQTFHFANVHLEEEWNEALGKGTIAWGESILSDISGGAAAG